MSQGLDFCLVCGLGVTGAIALPSPSAFPITPQNISFPYFLDSTNTLVLSAKENSNQFPFKSTIEKSDVLFETTISEVRLREGSDFPSYDNGNYPLISMPGKLF